MRRPDERLRTVARAAAVAAVSLLILAACAKEPVVLASQFTPPHLVTSQSPQRGAKERVIPSCRIRLGELRDQRIDPQATGTIGMRVVRASDPVAWLRSGLQSLSRDRRIAILDGSATEEPDLELSAELLKSYILSITTQKSGNVVVRVRFSRHGQTLDEQIYRGGDVGANWASGAEESQSTLDRALAELLKELDRDVVSRCGAAKAPDAKP
jgi:hypothetical protein